MLESVNQNRRRMLVATAFTVAAARFSKALAADAAGTASSFGPLKQVNAGLLNVGYVEIGPAEREAGHPPPRLAVRHLQLRRCRASACVGRISGDRAVRARLRHDTLPFARRRSATGNRPRLPSDLIAHMDALKIDKAILAGFDWGARSANIVAALWPERCKAMVSVSGYLIGSQEAGKMPLPPKNELEWWYQFYFATERGRAGYDKYRHDFAKLIWQIASPQWKFDDATFDRSAAAFDNPDHVAIVIHNYRWRLALAEGEPRYDDLDKRLAAGAGHHRAHHYARRRCQWRATPGTQRLCQ